MRNSILTHWERDDLSQHKQFCALVVSSCKELYGYEDAEVVVLLVQSKEFRFDPSLQSLCDLYLEYDVHDRVKCVVTLKKTETSQEVIDAEEIRFIMHDFEEIAICW